MSTTVNPDLGDSADLVAVWAARAADEKLGEDITVINVSQILGVCDWFVLTSGSSPRQVKAILDEVEETVAKETGSRPRSVEGIDTRRWVVMDYGDVIVHVFHSEDREFYRLERLFSDAPQMNWAAGHTVTP